MPSGRTPEDDGSGRRKFLKATGTAAVAATLAGCGGDGTATETAADTPTPTMADDETPADDDDTPADEETATPTPTPQQAFDFNYTGYGDYDSALADAYRTLDTDSASEKFAKSMERIYLDAPYRVYNYTKIQWPFNSGDWQGAVADLVDPPFASWGTEINNIKQSGGGEGGTFTYGMSTKPDSQNVTQSSSVYSAVAHALVYGGPVATDSQDTPMPWLYTDWQLASTDGDPLDVYFMMRTDAQFGDGESVTAEDVLFSYDYFVRNNISEYATINQNMVDLGIPDDASGTPTPAEGSHVIEQVDSTPDGVDLSPREGSGADPGPMFHAQIHPAVAWPVNTIGALEILPKHIWEGKDPKTFAPVDDGVAVGMGPGKLTKFSKDTSMRVEIVNDNYRNVLNSQQWVKDDPVLEAGGPFVDAVNFKIFGSESAMTQAFLQGGIDTHYGSISPSSRSQVRNTEGLSLVEGFDSGFGYFGLNVTRPPLDDACFRQAINFAWDERFWVESLQDNTVLDGDYSQSPGYPKGRPETYHDDAELLEAPETELYQYRRKDAGSPVLDVGAVRNFLTSGKVADGSGGTYAGVEYPGGLFDDVSATQSEAKHEYSFGPVKSDILKRKSATTKELRVNGKTIPEIMDGDPLQFITDPPANSPRQSKAMQNWMQNLRTLGIPAQTQVLSFNTLEAEVFYQQDFDVTELGWGGTSPYGASNYFFFHSDFYTG